MTASVAPCVQVKEQLEEIGPAPFQGLRSISSGHVPLSPFLWDIARRRSSHHHSRMGSFTSSMDNLRMNSSGPSSSKTFSALSPQRSVTNNTPTNAARNNNGDLSERLPTVSGKLPTLRGSATGDAVAQNKARLGADLLLYELFPSKVRCCAGSSIA